jgi:3-dehydroquinate dehydratase-1
MSARKIPQTFHQAKARSSGQVARRRAKRAAASFPNPRFAGLRPGNPLVVGTIHSRQCLVRARWLPPGSVDLFELRLDHFAKKPERLLDAIQTLRTPLIATARHEAEGGAGHLSAAKRRDLLARFIGAVAFIDVELRSLKTHAANIAAARESGVRIIVSEHHFDCTPRLSRLVQTVRAGQAAGAAIIKIATFMEDVRDLIKMLLLISVRRQAPLSLMGMGPLGKLSRLIFAATGSVLNYGYLGSAQVPGQWEALLLKTRLRELDLDSKNKH